jgi:hypothetical protein
MNRLYILAAVLCAATAATAARAENLVANGDFSEAADGKPAHWAAAGDAHVTQRLEVVRDASGNPYARLACAAFEKGGPSSHAMIAQTGQVALREGRTYEFVCRARAEGLAGGAVSVAVSNTRHWSNCGLRTGLSLTGRWKTFRRVFHATQTVAATDTRLQFWFAETGTLCLDDVRIAEVRMKDVAYTDVVPAADGRNRLRNGSFEAGPAGWSSEGTRTGWGNLSRLHGRVETGDAPHGRSFLRIPLGGEDTPVLAFDYYEATVRRELAPLAVNCGWIEVEPGKPHTVSAWMRAGRDGVRARLGVRNQRPMGGRKDFADTLRLTTGWKRYTVTFRPVHRYAYVLAGPDLEEEAEVHVDLDGVQLETGEAATAFAPRRTVEVGLAPSAPGGLFVAEEENALAVRLVNHGGDAARCTLAFEVTDFFDRPVEWPGMEAKVEPRTVLVRRLHLPPDWRGFYRVRWKLEAGGPAETGSLRLAVVPTGRGTDSVLGINHAFATPFLIRQAMRGGVGWFRDWSLKWQHVEPQRGTFRWERAGDQIRRVTDLGANLVCLLPPFPSADWISEAPDTLPKKGYPASRLPSAWAPKEPAELARFVGQAVARYKDRVRVWEFLNEPIYTDYALPGDAGNKYDGPNYTPADYVRLLAVASKAIKEADPGCRVIGGIGGWPLHLTREAIDVGVLDHVDILNIHTYPASQRPEGLASPMDTLLGMMDEAGRRVPVWITEFAYYGVDDLPREPFIPRRGSWAEARLLESERQCADRTVRYVAVMLSRGAQKVFIHSGSNGSPHRTNFECPLLAGGGAPRKVLPALAVLADVLGPEPTFVAERRFGKTGWALAFRNRRQSVVLLWNTAGETGLTVAVPPTPGLARLDPMGRPADGGPVTLGTSPAYLLGPPGKAKAILDALRPSGL